MARIKPQALLNQSKKKKGPSRISVTTIVFCNLFTALIVYALFATYRHLSHGSKAQMRSEFASFQDTNDLADAKKDDLHGYVIINTSKGDITVELLKDGSHGVVDKFIDFCQNGHFKGLPFNHVIKNYVLHGGNSRDLGDAEDWISKGKLRSQLVTSPKHEAFMVGTSKASHDTQGFELYITTAPIPDLNNKLLVFGRVIKGEDVVQEIEEVDTDEHYRPKSPVHIIDVTLKHDI